MQSKRLIEQLRRQDWVAVAIEFIIVVVGVLLAMQVANWNEQRLEHERGRAYYQRILTELRSNISDMDQRAAYYEQVIGHADAALVAFHDPASSLGEPLLVDLYQASQIQTGPITRASYDEAISSGALLSVGGPQLRVRLANYFSLAESSQMIYDETTPYRDRIRGLLPDAVQMPSPSGSFLVGNTRPVQAHTTLDKASSEGVLQIGAILRPPATAALAADAAGGPGRSG